MAAHGALQDTPMGEMNTTPLIDVMLVMLIMFLLTLPIQTHAISVDLPGTITEPGPELLRNRITIDAVGVTAWNGQQVSPPELAQLIQATQRMAPTPELLLEPSGDAPYVVVDQTLALIERSHVDAFGFVGNERYARAF
jgi:biopolymer transport protein ExbD